MENSNTSGRFNNWSNQLSQVSDIAKQIGGVANTVIDSMAEFGAFIPLLEIVVTIAAFWAAGLGEFFGVEVLIGLVFAQIGALYLTAHYRGVAMATMGQAAIYLAIVVGATNTGLAVYLALNAHLAAGIAPWAWQFPAFSSGLAVLFIYVAKMFTHEQVANRQRLRVASEDEIAELRRAAAAERARNAARDGMLQARLDMEAAALGELVADERMQGIQKRAMYLTVVKDIMSQYEILPIHKLGKQLLSLADEAVSGEETAVNPAAGGVGGETAVNSAAGGVGEETAVNPPAVPTVPGDAVTVWLENVEPDDHFWLDGVAYTRYQATDMAINVESGRGKILNLRTYVQVQATVHYKNIANFLSNGNGHAKNVR